MGTEALSIDQVIQSLEICLGFMKGIRASSVDEPMSLLTDDEGAGNDCA